MKWGSREVGWRRKWPCCPLQGSWLFLVWSWENFEGGGPQPASCCNEISLAALSWRGAKEAGGSPLAVDGTSLGENGAGLVQGGGCGEGVRFCEYLKALLTRFVLRCGMWEKSRVRGLSDWKRGAACSWSVNQRVGVWGSGGTWGCCLHWLSVRRLYVALSDMRTCTPKLEFRETVQAGEGTRGSPGSWWHLKLREWMTSPREDLRVCFT